MLYEIESRVALFAPQKTSKIPPLEIAAPAATIVLMHMRKNRIATPSNVLVFACPTPKNE